jgi:hypothetical protein
LKIPKGLTQHENPDKFRVIFRRAQLDKLAAIRARCRSAGESELNLRCID